MNGKMKGLLAFLVVLFVMPLGHALMILMEVLFGEGGLYSAALVMGVAGVVLVYLGIRRGGELFATWSGFFGGVLVWTGWVEFGYVFFAKHLGVAPLMEGGEVVTKAEYLVLLSSLALLVATLPYFMLNNQTRCPFFTWLQRALNLGLRRTRDGQPRYIAVITFIETIYILWLFYLLLLLVYDPKLFGDRHIVTYVVFFGSLLWSVYLFLRLLRIRAFAYSIRYAIPTVVIFWNAVEILGRWGFFEEIWVEPLEHWLEMILILVAFTGALLISTRFRDRRVSPWPEVE